MKKLFPAVLITLITAGVIRPLHAEEKKGLEEKAMTAIEAASMIGRGTADDEIINKLLKQRGFEKMPPNLEGKPKEGIIRYLLALPEMPEKKTDKGRTAVHRMAGEKFLKEGAFGKAAEEFSLAARYSPADYEFYRFRGDSYLGYLKANLSPPAADAPEKTVDPLFQKKRKLICGGIYADYRTTSRLIDMSIRDNINELERLNVKMMELRQQTDPTLQFKRRSQENINIMRERRRLLYSQASAKSATNHLKEAMSDYRKACPTEEKERADLVRQARDKAREKKWVKYGEMSDATYFYDKSTLKKGKDGTTVISRKENTDEEKSYDLVKVKLLCGKKMITKLETSSYGEDGKQTANRQFKKAEPKKIAPESPEQLLFGRICK